MWPWRRYKTIRAREFILENKNGRSRARLGMDESRNVVLSFLDARDRMGLFLGLTRFGTPRLTLGYGEGRGSVELEANDRLDCAGLSIVSSRGELQVALGVAQGGRPALVLMDKDGKMVFPESPAGPARDEKRGETGDGGFDWDDLLRE